MDPLRPIAPTDRTVPAVELTRLTPLERERDRRERERKRRQAGSRTTPEKPADEGDSRLDVRV